jgi:hypothetical protein
LDSESSTDNYLDELWASDSVSEKSDGDRTLEKHKKRVMFISQNELSNCDPKFHNEIKISRANLYKEIVKKENYLCVLTINIRFLNDSGHKKIKVTRKV